MVNPTFSEEGWDAEAYQEGIEARLADRAAEGGSIHGEVDFLMAFAPHRVLDAGCGTGRVAAELARRQISVVGIDADPAMVDLARREHPGLSWLVGDLADFEMAETFDVVVMAGNVLIFTPPDSQAAVLARCADHLSPDGHLVSGFQLGHGYEVSSLDDEARAAGLELVGRWSSWDRDAFTPESDYAVSVHRLRGLGA